MDNQPNPRTAPAPNARRTRTWTAAALGLALAALVAATPAAQAVNVLTYSFVVDCSNAAGASTAAQGITVPSGTYAVTVTGACVFTNPTATYPIGPFSTPCSVPVVGTVPCVSSAFVTEPGATCTLSVGVAYTLCTNGPLLYPMLMSCTSSYRVVVDGQCVNGAGFVNHPGGAVTASFIDPSNYGDNVGSFVVTLQWTPL